MKKFRFIVPSLILTLVLLTSNSCKNEQKAEAESPTTNIDLVQARKIIEAIDKQFAEDISNADSLALAAHYATDGTWGTIQGKDNLISAWGKSIRNAVKNRTPNVQFTTNSLFSDGEYLIELGVYEFSDNDHNVKSQGKYLVVWKQEDGEWKIYRDIGL
jgi:ketosteroid isomerase-like protein